MSLVLRNAAVIVMAASLALPAFSHELWLQASVAEDLDDAAPFPPLEQNAFGGGLSLDLSDDWTVSASLSRNQSGLEEWSLSSVYAKDVWSVSLAVSGLSEDSSRAWQDSRNAAQLDQARDEHSLRIALSRAWDRDDLFADVSLSLARTESDSTRTAVLWRDHPTLGRVLLQAGRETAHFEDWTLDLDVTVGTWWFGETWAVSPYLGGGWSIGLSEQAEGETVGLRRFSQRSVVSGRTQSAFASTPDTGYLLAGITFYPSLAWRLDVSHSFTVGGEDDQPVTTLTLGYSWGEEDGGA